MASREVTAISALLLAWGCGATREPIELPSAASLLLAVQHGGQTSVFAIDGEGEGAAGLPVFDEYVGDTSIELSANLYDLDLERLSIAPGLLAPGGDGGLPPLAPRTARRTIDRRGSGAWSISTDLPLPLLSSFRSPALPLDPCMRELHSRTVNLALRGGSDQVVALMAEGDDVLAITSRPETRRPRTNQLYRLHFGVVPSAERLDPPGFEAIGARGGVITAARSRDGRIWVSVASDLSEIWVGTSTGGFAPLPRQRTDERREWPWWLAVEERDDGPRIWALGDAGSVNRYDSASGSWTTVQASNIDWVGCASPTQRCGGIAISPAGEVAFVDTRDPNRVYRVEGDRVIGEPLATGTLGELTAIASTPLGFAVLQSSSLSTTVYVRGASGWAPLAEGIDTQRVFALAPWRSGWIMAGSFGLLIQHTGLRTCPVIEGLASGLHVSHAVTTPRGIALAAGWAATNGKIPPEVAMITLDQ